MRRWLAMPLHRQDSWLRWMLVALAAIDLATTVALSAHPRYWLYAEFGIYVLGSVGFTGLVLLLLRTLTPDFSPAAVLWFIATILVFNVWNFVVMVVSAWTGWWHDAQPGYRFLISALLGVMPLIASIGVLTRKLRLIS